jgi:hypothetical protein
MHMPASPDLPFLYGMIMVKGTVGERREGSKFTAERLDRD